MLIKMHSLAVLSVLLLSISACGPTAAGSNTPSATALEMSSATEPPVASVPPFVEQVSAQVNIPAGETGSAIASCPTDSLPVSGGFATGEMMLIYKTVPDPAGWLVEGLNTSAAALPLTVYAYCLHNTSGTVSAVALQQPMTPNEYGGGFAMCQNNELVTGGGYDVNANDLEVYLSTPMWQANGFGNGWNVMALNKRSMELSIDIYAVCLSGSGLTNTRVYPESLLSDPVNSNVACPAGSLLVAGGYQGTGTYVTRINPADASLWEVSVESGSRGGDETMNTVICLNLP